MPLPHTGQRHGIKDPEDLEQYREVLWLWCLTSCRLNSVSFQPTLSKLCITNFATLASLLEIFNWSLLLFCSLLCFFVSGVFHPGRCLAQGGRHLPAWIAAPHGLPRPFPPCVAATPWNPYTHGLQRGQGQTETLTLMDCREVKVRLKHSLPWTAERSRSDWNPHTHGLHRDLKLVSKLLP